MVLVQFRVTVSDVDRFKAAFEKHLEEMKSDGAVNPQLWSGEANPNELSMMAEWESHDAMMESSDKRGDEFQADAGTEGLDWETRIWHRLA